jgi:cyclophilin family peptidyl-prolyl cis-trans isomerase/HEAT repeat protein
LQLALMDLDWRVACEAALALEARPTEGATAALVRSIEHTSSHVRRAAALALSRSAEQTSPQSRDQAVQGLERALRDVSPAVRGGALIARTRLDLKEPADPLPEARLSARTLAPTRSAQDRLRESMSAADPHLRVAAASASALFDPQQALPLLAELAADQHPLVAGAAIEELGRLGTPEALSLVRAALVGADDGVRLAAVLALGEAAGPQDVPLLEQALELASGEIEPEIAFNTARLLGRIGGEEARRSCLALAAHEDAWVRSVARSTCFERFEVPEDGPPIAPFAAPPLEARLERPTRNPLVRIDTTRGSLVFELYPAECPLHVHSFLTKARAGFYEDTPFHRVVPDFVVQGGDARGDGNGGASWRGDSLRNEFTPRKFARGTLGMPRNENPDSGGSQIFITQRATPHLDGRYTAFGGLRAGADVLDRLEIGDRILAVVELKAAPR